MSGARAVPGTQGVREAAVRVVPPGTAEAEVVLGPFAKEPSPVELEVLGVAVRAVLGVPVRGLPAPGGAWRLAGRPWRQPGWSADELRDVFNHGGKQVDNPGMLVGIRVVRAAGPLLSNGTDRPQH